MARISRSTLILGLIGALGCGSSGASNSGGTFTSNPSASSSGGDIGGTSGGDTAAADTGATDAGTTSSSGAADTGPVDTGPPDTGPVDTGPEDTGPEDTGPVDAGKPDTGPVKTCEFDSFIGPTGLECESGQVCVGNQGQCSGKVQGICKPKIVQCPDIKAAVCGCDDNDYKNACEAQKSGATLKSNGKCGGAPVACGGKTGVVCPKDFTCDVTTCDPGASGICVPLPQGSCPVTGIPECGCDGKEYPNSCFRLKAQTALKNKGSCPTAGTDPCKIGPAGKPTKCPANHYCKLNINNPVDCTGDGECTPIPQSCAGVVQEVCGCDFTTYGNPCLMAKQSVSMKSPGKCGGGSGDCVEGKGTCPVGMYCGVPLGSCGAKGVCINKPAAAQCTPDVDLVCGCNGTTYSNAGCAAVAGVIVKNKGKCP